MDQLADQDPGCDAVKRHIATPIPQRLWHYTTFAGFQGILTSKKIWASEYRFLNDREEFRHAKTLSEELIDQTPESKGLSFPARESLREGIDVAFNSGPLHESRLRIMVASFSEQGDQLGQWRGYAGDSTGVSMGLDLRGLRPACEEQTTVTFAPCIYLESEKRRVLNAVFSHYLDRLEGWWNAIAHEAFTKGHPEAGGDLSFGQRIVREHASELQQVMQRGQMDLLFDLMRIAPLLKHASFEEEREWRLVLPSESVRLPINYPIEFRATRSALVPYIAFPLLQPNQEGPIPCYELILGPGSHPSAEVGVNLLFQSQLMLVQARNSNVPYRPA